MIHYSLIFLFTSLSRRNLFDQHVLLVQKSKPEWQKGLWNGLGGHLELGEDILQGALRELAEESGVDLRPRQKHFQLQCPTDPPEHRFTVVGDDFELHVVRAVIDFREVESARRLTEPGHTLFSATNDPVNWFHVRELPVAVIDNVHWMVPLLLDPHFVVPAASGPIRLPWRA